MPRLSEEAHPTTSSALPPALISTDFPPLTTAVGQTETTGDSSSAPMKDTDEAKAESRVISSDPVTPPKPVAPSASLPLDVTELSENQPLAEESPLRETKKSEVAKIPVKSTLKTFSHRHQKSKPADEAKPVSQERASNAESTTKATKEKGFTEPTSAQPILPGDSHKKAITNKPLTQNEPLANPKGDSSPAMAVAGPAVVDSSRPSSSGTSSSQATLPAPRNPRTLRLIPATKIEVPSKAAAPPPEVIPSTSSAAAKQPTKIQDIESARQPGTPINELISDTASLTSASPSRPPSPPAGKVGAAPGSQKSKQQAKKERAARAKQIEEAKHAEESASSPVHEEVIQAPIIGRKKKSKKPKTAAAAAKAIDSDISSAQVEDADAKEQREKEIKAAVATATQDTPANERNSGQKAQQSGTHVDAAAELAKAPINPSLSAGTTAASIFSDLQREGILSSAALDMILNPTGVNTRFDASTAPNFGYSEPTKLTVEEKKLLNRGDCVAKKVNPQEWAVIMPDRSVLRHFSREEAERYVELRKSLAENGASFTSPEFPADSWLNFTSNDLLSGFQVAPPILDSDDEASADAESPEALIQEYASTIMRPDSKDAQYATLYPPRTQSENDEIEARIAMMTVEELDQTLKASEELLQATRKEVEGIEKRLNQAVKKNRKTLKDWV